MIPGIDQMHDATLLAVRFDWARRECTFEFTGAPSLIEPFVVALRRAVYSSCSRPMFFVGQIDDDRICMEPPAGAELWWHDKASFYVFTCSKCLECKAVGQQM